MTRNEFIDWLDSIGAVYDCRFVEGDRIYVYDRKMHTYRRMHPEKFRTIYVPYIRIGNFDSDMYYTRYNGIVEYMPESEVMSICMELTK